MWNCALFTFIIHYSMFDFFSNSKGRFLTTFGMTSIWGRYFGRGEKNGKAVFLSPPKNQTKPVIPNVVRNLKQIEL